MFGKVKNLTAEENPGTQRPGACSVQRAGEQGDALGRRGGPAMQERYAAEHEPKARPRSEGVPVGRDEEQEARCEEQPAQSKGQRREPVRVGPDLSRLPVADAQGRRILDEPRSGPADQRGFP